MSYSIGIRIILWTYLLNITVRGQGSGPNAVVPLHGQTMLDCNTIDLSSSTWRHTPDGNSNFITVATNCSVTGNNAAYYRTELIGGNVCRLTIANVTMQQAGVYNCYDGGSTVYKSLVTVIDPVASVVVYNGSEIVDGDQLNISCSVDYNAQTSSAPLRPSPYLTSPGQNFTSAIYHPSANVVTVVATLKVRKPTVPGFQCMTVFEITGNTTGFNPIPPPDNLTVGSTTELDVQYVPSTPVITSRPDAIAINGVSCGISVLTCSSTGNPIPNYRWYDTAENVILSTTDTLTLAEINRNYRCEAYSTIRNVLYSPAANYTISKDKCVSTVDCCVFPRDETTSVTVKGCDNGTSCDCTNGTGGIILTCNAKTFPNASYMWSGPDIEPIDSPVYDKVTANGSYRCTAYFNKASSNYTGGVIFPNGTNDSTVSQCCATWELAISFVIPYIGGNVIFLVVFMVLHFKHSGFKSLMDNRFPGTTTLTIVLLSIASVCFGLFIIPIAVTIAFCSSLKQVGDVSSKPGGPYQMDGISDRSGSRQESGDSSAEVSNQRGGNVANAGPGIPGWSIAVMWCVDAVLLFPITFVVVYCVPCNQMRFEIS